MSQKTQKEGRRRIEIEGGEKYYCSREADQAFKRREVNLTNWERRWASVKVEKVSQREGTDQGRGKR